MLNWIGDWASSCIEALKYLNINISIEEIKSMRKNRFQNILKRSTNEKALEYLLERRGTKGKEIKYLRLKMSEYLLPQKNENLSITEKQYIFAIRNRMIDIEFNFPKNKISKTLCCCGEVENMKHIYSCKILNQESIKTSFEEIFNDDVRKQKNIYERFKNNFDKRLQGIQYPVDPLHTDICAVMEIN